MKKPGETVTGGRSLHPGQRSRLRRSKANALFSACVWLQTGRVRCAYSLKCSEYKQDDSLSGKKISGQNGEFLTKPVCAKQQLEATEENQVPLTYTNKTVSLI